jgi:hypothetical protein
MFKEEVYYTGILFCYFFYNFEILAEENSHKILVIFLQKSRLPNPDSTIRKYFPLRVFQNYKKNNKIRMH